MDYGYLDMFDIIIFETLEGASLMFHFQIRTQFSLPQSTETNKKNVFKLRLEASRTHPCVYVCPYVPENFH